MNEYIECDEIYRSDWPFCTTDCKDCQYAYGDRDCKICDWIDSLTRYEMSMRRVGE